MTAPTELLPCPFCGKAMMLRGALWPSEGDRDAVIHAEPTDCPLYDFSNDTFDESIVEVWNRRLPASEAGWREITDEDRPPNDEEVLMGCWENWPSQKWMVEYGLYGSTKGGWIHGRMTHWLPSSFLPSAPDRRPA